MKIIKISIIVLMGSSMLIAGANQMKLYDIKSGKIEYEIKGSGEVMGQKMQTIGKKSVIFDDNGGKNLTEENKIDKQTIMGQTKTTKTHTMTYMKESMVYHVDFKSKRIMRMGNMAAAMGALMGGEKNMKQTGEEIMKKMGGKKTGTDKILGYTCDVWELMGTKQCIYKGIPLKVETNIMGISNKEIATKAEFDISLSKDDFKLPDFPIYDESGEKLNIDRARLDEMDAKESAKSLQNAEDGMKAMGAAMGALKDSGFDMNNPNAKMTKEQEQAMQKAMMNAMGGGKAILAKAKQEILEDVKMIPFARECFNNANSIKEANMCEQKIDSEDPENHTEWDDEIKADLLKELNTFENIIPCVKKAETFKALKMCMPQD
jgi:hypothetical protein